VNDPDEAADLTQGFFAHLIEGDGFRTVQPNRGRLRAFLLGCCNHFLADERAKAMALKRGGGERTLSWDWATAEGRVAMEPSHQLTPERSFERRWALTLLEEALQRLEREYRDTARNALFEALKPLLVGEPEANTHADIAVRLEMTPTAIKKAAQRLRDRYRELIRELVGDTVDDPAEISEEIRHLMAVVSSGS
jgi:RNA polymerase sigma-70 factor (ECF subfamily)